MIYSTWGFRVAQLMRWCLPAAVAALLVLAAPAAEGAPSGGYVGAKRCKSCHERAFTVWSRGPHARSLESLTEDQRRDPKCNSCHTMLPEVVAEADSRLLGVQCESCHGPGRYYVAEYVMRDAELSRAVGLLQPDAALCQRCHTAGAPSVSPFDFDRLWAIIKHGQTTDR